MSLVPTITQTILDGGLGIPATTAQLLHVKVGISSAGPRNVARLQTDVNSLVSTYQEGPLTDGASYHIQQTGALWTLRTLTSNVGSIGSVTKVPAGVSVGTMTATLSTYLLHAVIAAGAPLNVTTGWVTLPIPGLITIVLGAGGVATNYTVIGKGLSGELQSEVIAASGAGSFISVLEYTSIISLTSNVNPTGTTTVNQISTTPVNSYDVIVEITAAGSIAGQTAQYHYSLDGGITFSPSLVIPAGGVIDLQTYAPGGSTNPYLGFKLTFVDVGSPAFLLGDKWTFATLAPTWSLNDLLTALDAVANDKTVRQNFSGFHVIGAATGTIFVGVEAQLQSYADTKYLYRFCYLESARQGVTVEATWAAAVVTDFSSTGVRTGVIAMDMDVITPSSRTVPRRNWGAVYVARLMACPISELPSHVEDETVYGIKTALDGVVKLYQGDSSVATLTLANICTARAYATRTGFYCTRGLMKTLETSDYRDITNRRVMDVAATVGYDAALTFLQATLLADPTTGRLGQDEANKVKTFIENKLSIVLEGGQRRHVSALAVNVSTANPFLQDRTLNTNIRIVPRGAVDFINQTYSYTPAIT